MKPGKDQNYHLTYCTNIHSGERWSDHFEQIKTYVPQIKQELCPDRAFGIGLRLSNQGAMDLSDQSSLSSFKKWMEEENCYVFTINGFPFGDFHQERVKENAYRPDWSQSDRFSYTLNLIKLLAEFLPEGMEGSISTIPLSYKYWWDSDSKKEKAIEKSIFALVELVHELTSLKRATGKLIHLDLEPEPDCLIENTADSIDFFQNQLWTRGAELLAKKCELPLRQAKHLLRRHIGVCLDICHFAVEFESSLEALKTFQKIGIKIGKIQISSALSASCKKENLREELFTKLKKFDEPTYLHQVVARSGSGELVRYRDLNFALEEGGNKQLEEWRVHFHVPLFWQGDEVIGSTREDIIELLNYLKNETRIPHLEIETYTWDVLPGNLKLSLKDSILREYRWVLSQMNNL